MLSVRRPAMLQHAHGVREAFRLCRGLCSSAARRQSDIQVSTLPNQLRVATEAMPGHFSAVGVYVDAGSRYERPWIPGESGVSHVLDRMAFKSTTTRSSADMEQLMQAVGGNVMCASSRETMMYQSSVFNQDVRKVLEIFADTIQNPMLDPGELAIQREAAAWEVGEIWNKPEMILPEMVHAVAFKDNTLGHPLLCPLESLDVMTTDNLREYMRHWYRPERIVVAGAGMAHEDLVSMSTELFGGMRSNPPDPVLAQLANERARYTGGELYIPDASTEFTHVYVAYEGFSIHDDDIYPLATMQMLLGGGGSFSAGGPGKGMYSRLYTNVLNQYHAVDHCASFHHCYADSGLFGMSASVHPSFNATVPYVIARELELCTSGLYRGSVTKSEWERAKNQLKSSLVMALESRLVEVEDLGRQVLVHGHKISVNEMCAAIDRLTLDDLHRVAKRVLMSGKPSTVVAQGDVEGLGDVRQLLASRGM